MSITQVPLQRSNSDVTKVAECILPGVALYTEKEKSGYRQDKVASQYKELEHLGRNGSAMDGVEKGMRKRGYHFVELDHATLELLRTHNAKYGGQPAKDVYFRDAMTFSRENIPGIKAFVNALSSRFASPPFHLECSTYERSALPKNVGDEGFHVDNSVISTVVKLHGNGGTEVVVPSSRKDFVKAPGENNDFIRKPEASVEVVETPDNHMVVLFGRHSSVFGQNGTVHRTPPADHMFRDVSLTFASRPR